MEINSQSFCRRKKVLMFKIILLMKFTITSMNSKLVFMNSIIKSNLSPPDKIRFMIRSQNLSLRHKFQITVMRCQLLNNFLPKLTNKMKCYPLFLPKLQDFIPCSHSTKQGCFPAKIASLLCSTLPKLKRKDFYLAPFFFNSTFKQTATSPLLSKGETKISLSSTATYA